VSTATPTNLLDPESDYEDGVYYPPADGVPMAETSLHIAAIIMLVQALEHFFRERPDVFIASDLFWYWEQGNPNARLAPDVMIIPGVGRQHRRSFRSWREGGAVPAAVVEMASKNTWREDLHDKYTEYQRRGVREYFLYDPEGRYLRPRLQPFRLEGGVYRRLPTARDGSVRSELGFRLRGEGEMLRLIDGRTRTPILTYGENFAQTQALARQVEQQQRLIEQLQAELQQLRHRLEPGTEGHGA
jgi:Uma2 family endonuclease